MNVVDSMFSDSASRVEGYRKAASIPAGLGNASWGFGSSLSNPYATNESSAIFSAQERLSIALYRASKKDNAYTAIRPIVSRLIKLPIRIGTKKTRVVAPAGRMTKAVGVYGDRDAGRALTVRQKFLMPDMFKDLAEGIDIQNDHPLEDLLENPNELTSRSQLIGTTAWSLQATGWGIWWLDSNDAGGIEKIWYVPRHWVIPIHTAERSFAAWLFKPPNVEQGFLIDDRDIAAFRLPDPSDPVGALSPLASQYRAVIADDEILTAQVAGLRAFTKPGMVVVMGRLDAPANQAPARPVLNAAQRREVSDVIRLGYAGAVKNGEPIILDGLIENIYPYLPGVSEMDFPGSSQLTRDRIHRGMGVNPVVTGETADSNRASAYVAVESFTENVTNPLGVMMSEVMTKKIGSRYASAGQKVYVWLEKDTPRDDELINSRIQIMMDGECIKKDEVREAFGLEPLGGSDGDALVTRPQKPAPGDAAGAASGKRGGDAIASGGGKSGGTKKPQTSNAGGKGDRAKIGKSITTPAGLSAIPGVNSSRRHRRRL